jgi:Outer membrane protein beta-barrel domain
LKIKITPDYQTILMKKFTFFFLLVIPFFSFSQIKGKKALIVMSNNDTVYGFIDDKEWLSNPSAVKLKKNQTGTFTEYKASQLKSIHINDGDYYESHLITIDNTPSEFEGASFDSSQILKVEKHAFLLVQFSNAEVILYSYRAKNQMRFYLRRGNEIPQELIYRRYTVRKDNGIFEMEDKSFTDQLSFLAENCNEAAKKLMALSYKLSDITDLLKIYYKNCGKSTTTYLHKQMGKGKFSVSLLGGISKTSLSFKGPNPDAVYVGVITRTALKTNPSISPGIRLTYLIPRAHQKFSISLDFYYNQFSAIASEYTYNNSPNDYETKILTINPKYMHSSLGLKYFLNRENNLRPFLQAGVSESIMLSEKSEAMWNKYSVGSNTITTGYPFPNNSLKKSSFGEFIGFGLSYKKLGIDFRYHTLGSLARFSAISSLTHASTIFISYQLTR